MKAEEVESWTTRAAALILVGGVLNDLDQDLANAAQRVKYIRAKIDGLLKEDGWVDE